MDSRLNRLFWINYVAFCIFMVLLLQLTDQFDVTTMSRGQHVILTGCLIACGIVMRHWFKSNPEEVKRKFKIKE